MELHPVLEPVAALLGTWRGEGHGEYPTIEPFDYVEEVAFWHVGKPFLAYRQRTWAPATGTALHGEAGYWRPIGDGGLEVVMSHPFGATEVLVGTVERGAVRLVSRSVSLTPTAKRIDAVERDVDCDGEVLRYAVRMAAVGQPLTHHLAAELRRSG